jgi:mono/diheme cytochrome c family protein
MSVSTRAWLGACVAVPAVLALGTATNGMQQPAAAPARTVWDGVYSDEQSRRGQRLAQARCVSCHGDELAGGEAPGLVGDDFKAIWSGKPVVELFDKIQFTMPADTIGSLKPQQSADLVAYIFKLNAFPAGESDIEADKEKLAEIRISSQK